jgi:hypothetical protein
MELSTLPWLKYELDTRNSRWKDGAFDASLVKI